MSHLLAFVEKQRDHCGDHADWEKEIDCERFQATTYNACHNWGLAEGDCAYAANAANAFA